MTLTIIDFLRTGGLPDLPFGTSREAITGRLGDNPDWSVPISRRDKRPALIKYGRIEFYFDAAASQKLRGILVTYSMPADTKGLVMDYDALRECLGYQQVMDFLSRNGIPFEEEVSEYDPGDQVIRTNSQVIFYFNDNKTLQKLGRFL